MNLRNYVREKEERISKSKWNKKCNGACSLLAYVYGVNWNYLNKMSLLDAMKGYVDEYLEVSERDSFWLYCPMDEIKEWLAAKYLMECGYVSCEEDFLALFSLFIDEESVFDLDGCFEAALEILDYTKMDCGAKWAA